MLLFFRDIAKSMRRRVKEIRLLIIVEFLTMAFLTAALLFQHNSENYSFERNKSHYGEWTVAEINTDPEGYPQQLRDHAYFSDAGRVFYGIPIVDEKGTLHAGTLGSMDETFLEIGHMELREGRFPEAADEIVMEAGLLIEMGYSLEPGQRILLTFTDMMGQSEVRSFELVGVVRGSAGLWSIGSYMPNALVTEEAIADRGYLLMEGWCYRLSEQYEGIDVSELYGNLSERYTSLIRDGWVLEYNKYLYDTSFWGTEEMYTAMERSILLFGISAVSFLLTAYIQKRKRAYYNLRTIGMSKLRVKIMILFESLCVSVPSGILAIIFTIAGGALFSLILTLVHSIQYFYEVPLRIVLHVLLTWLIIFAGSDLIAMFVTGRKRLYGNTHEISTRFLFRWRLNKLRQKHVYSSIFIREHRVFWLRSLFGGLVSFVFALLLLLCGARLWEQYYVMRLNTQVMDFAMNKISEDPIDAGTWRWKFSKGAEERSYVLGDSQLYTGFGESFYERLNSIDGITSYDLSTFDNAHLFEWENWEQDAFVRRFLNSYTSSIGWYEDGEQKTDYNNWYKVLDGNSLQFGYMSWFVPEGRELFDKYQKYYDTGTMDYDRFERGEQAILFLSAESSFLAEGGIFYIVAGEERIPVEIACVIPTEAMPWGTDEYPELIGLIGSSPGAAVMAIIASEALGRRIAEAEQREFMYNRIMLNVDHFANYSTSVKQCADLFAGENMSGHTWYEMKDSVFHRWMTQLLMYGTFLIMLFAFFIVIRSNIIQAGFTFQGNQIRRLRMLGMGKEEIKRMYLLQGIYESRWLWLSIVVVYAIRLKELYEEYRFNGTGNETTMFYVEKLQRYVIEDVEIVRYTYDRYINFGVCIVIVAVILGINVATRYFVAGSYLKHMDEERQGDL